MQKRRWEKVGTLFKRLIINYTRDEKGKRPVYGGSERVQMVPTWRDYILFYKYYLIDNGAGLGATHQTGWSGVVAKLLQSYGLIDPEKLLEIGENSKERRNDEDTAKIFFTLSDQYEGMANQTIHGFGPTGHS